MDKTSATAATCGWSLQRINTVFVYHWRNLLQKDFLQMDAIASVVDELFLKYAIDGEGW